MVTVEAAWQARLAALAPAPRRVVVANAARLRKAFAEQLREAVNQRGGQRLQQGAGTGVAGYWIVHVGPRGGGPFYPECLAVAGQASRRADTDSARAGGVSSLPAEA